MGPGGYAWWYIDALSDDGRHGLSLIAFIGSVFSPYYAWSGWADPFDHCAVNVALYEAGDDRWAMTERGRGALRRSDSTLEIGPTSFAWGANGLTVAFREITAPIPRRISGTIRLMPEGLVGQVFRLDSAGRHFWRPIAPRAEVEVTLTGPPARWRGTGYFDSNLGREPLHRGFTAWDWCRVHRRHDTLVFYDVARRGGEEAGLAMRIGRSGDIAAIDSPPRRRLPATLWRMPRSVRWPAESAPNVSRTLEDTPFYARTALDGTFGGEHGAMVHESLSLNRLASPVVRAMLPFRMPRALW